MESNHSVAVVESVFCVRSTVIKRWIDFSDDPELVDDFFSAFGIATELNVAECCPNFCEVDLLQSSASDFPVEVGFK